MTNPTPDPTDSPGPSARTDANHAGGPSAPDPAGMTFDQALAELQGVVLALEAGGTPLEASIALYERGVALHERCAALLADAELRVSRLVERAGGAIATLELKPTDDAPSG